MPIPFLLRRLCGLALIAAATPAAAATYTVANLNDSGPGSLRQAVLNALATPVDDVIEFASSLQGVILLDSPLPHLLSSGGALTINGNGPAHTIIDSGSAHRPLRAENQDNLRLSLNRLTLRNGRATDGQGGAIYLFGGSGLLTIDTVQFENNAATYSGGAVYSEIAARITNSTFSGNGVSSGLGAAIDSSAADLFVGSSTFTGNTGPISVVRASPSATGTARLVNLTVAGNTANAGVHFGPDGTASISNSLVVGGGSAGDISRDNDVGGLANSRNNVLGSAGNSGIANGVGGNQVGVTAPLLSPLGNYGGPTLTMALLPGSPALNAGTGTGSDIPTSDQRGVGRVGTTDVGAFESRGFGISAASGTPQSATVGTAFAAPLVAAVSPNAAGEPVAGGVVLFAAPGSGARANLAAGSASIGTDGRAQTTATANATAGGPYTVTATLANGGGTPQTASFSLTNTPIAVPPQLTINDVTLNEGHTGTTAFSFTVSLSAPAPAGGVTFDIATANNTATAPGDYTARSLTGQTIPAGSTSYPFTVDVKGDSVVEPNETFFVNVTNVTNATVADGQGVGTITNDDADPCAGMGFPYTLTGASNAARVAALRQAVTCANANATADVIDLGGFAVTFDDPDAGMGDNALPEITSAITLRNGALQRSTNAATPAFRLLAVASGGRLTADSVDFRNGRAWDGGAIRNAGVLELRNAGFFGNGDLTQTEYGGAIYSTGDTLRVVGSRFEGNRAEYGGAVYVDGGDAYLRTSHLENNQARQGGALFGQTGLIRLLGNDFVANSADEGGAIFATRIGISASGLRFERNQATTQGGALAASDLIATLRLANSLFVGNEAPQGAVLHADLDVQLSNATISGHASGGPGGSLLVMTRPGESVWVFNSIVWGNGATPLGEATPSHSVVEGGFPGGTRILDVDPRFIDAAGGDFRLAAGSPAIDAGSNDDVLTDTWMDIDEDGDSVEELDDLDGNPRRHDDAGVADTGVADTGVGTAPLVDLGAFERQNDSPPAGVTVAPASGLVTSEAGGTATFTVVLDTRPTAGVTIALASSDTSEGTVSPASLTFTPANWNVPQTATVTGVDDAVADGDVAYTITVGPAASSDANYNGIDPADVSATNTDDDGVNVGVAVNPASGLATTEAGDAATFTVVLGTQPTADVTIPLASSDATEGTVSPASLTFTPVNWNVPQTVAITGVDDAEVDGDIAYTIAVGPSASGDARYDGLAAAAVQVLNRDDDTAPVTPVPVPVGGPWALAWMGLSVLAAAGAFQRRRQRKA